MPETGREAFGVDAANRWIKWLVLLLIAVAGVYWTWIGLTTPELRPVVISPFEPPILKPDETRHAIGRVPMDQSVSHTFRITNVGGQPLRITEAVPSCGCTVANLDHQVLKPGDSAALTVTLDTSLKLGHVKKKITVMSNDPVNPEFDLFLEGEVYSNLAGHNGQMALTTKDRLVLFKGKCATCHVQRGKGKAGKALFQADCGMCHGLGAQGAVAPALLSLDMTDPSVEAHVQQVITAGSPNSPTMPPFGQAHGGPLTEDEIASLVGFLRYQSKLHTEGKLDADGELKEDDSEG